MSRSAQRFTKQLLALLLLVVAGLAVTRAGHAGGGAPIAVVRDPETDERTLTRLRAELDALGLEMVEVPAPTGSGPRDLEGAARDVGAFAALRIVSRERGIEVWIADRVTGKTLLRELVVAPGETAEEVVALRAVELLRASLLELELPHERAGALPAPPAVERLVSSQPRRTQARFAPHLELDLGAGPLLSPGGVDPTWQLLVSARLIFLQRLGVEAIFSLPTLPSTIRDAEGSAEVSVFLAGVGLSAELLPTSEPWLARAALGAGVAALRMVGSATPLYLGRTDTVIVALPYGRLDLLYRLAPVLRIGASIGAGLALPRAAVVFADRRVATWGRPASSGALLLELDFK